MIYIFWLIIFIALIIIILKFNNDDNEDYIIEETNDLDGYLKESIFQLKTKDCFYYLSDVVDYATRLNFRNNYDKATIKDLNKEECDKIRERIHNNYEALLNDIMRRNSNIQNYLLKYFMDDIAF